MYDTSIDLTHLSSHITSISSSGLYSGPKLCPPCVKDLFCTQEVSSELCGPTACMGHWVTQDSSGPIEMCGALESYEGLKTDKADVNENSALGSPVVKQKQTDQPMVKFCVCGAPTSFHPLYTCLYLYEKRRRPRDSHDLSSRFVLNDSVQISSSSNRCVTCVCIVTENRMLCGVVFGNRSESGA